MQRRSAAVHGIQSGLPMWLARIGLIALDGDSVVGFSIAVDDDG